MALRPDTPAALFGRGTARAELKRHDEALSDFGRLLAVDPDHPYARGTALRRAQEACDWRPSWPRPSDIEADVRAGKPTVASFAFLGMSAPPEPHLACAQTWMRRDPPPPAALR